ncbi:MAG TPA: hypothetical protein VFO29_07230 [Candidatus Rubrimentiphilum sp.]|nr:hypothetical protein [Candidatus Rubrimentiphilum sp.]
MSVSVGHALADVNTTGKHHPDLDDRASRGLAALNDGHLNAGVRGARVNRDEHREAKQT